MRVCVARARSHGRWGLSAVTAVRVPRPAPSRSASGEVRHRGPPSARCARLEPWVGNIDFFAFDFHATNSIPMCSAEYADHNGAIGTLNTQRIAYKCPSEVTTFFHSLRAQAQRVPHKADSRRGEAARGRFRARSNGNRSHLTTRHIFSCARLGQIACRRATCDSGGGNGGAWALRQAAIRWQGGKHAGRAAAHQNRTTVDRAPAHCTPHQRLVLERELRSWSLRGRRENVGSGRAVRAVGDIWSVGGARWRVGVGVGWRVHLPWSNGGCCCGGGCPGGSGGGGKGSSR